MAVGDRGALGHVKEVLSSCLGGRGSERGLVRVERIDWGEGDSRGEMNEEPFAIF